MRSRGRWLRGLVRGGLCLGMRCISGVLVQSAAECAGLRAAYDRGDLRGFFRQNVRLSEQIYLAAGSATLKRLLGNIGKQALRYRYIAYRDAPELMGVSIEANSEILDAIARKRWRHARLLTEDVIQRSWTRVREIIAAMHAAGTDAVIG